jgi:hypothetical protein
VAGRKLKVFQAQFGFYDTVVAAPSRAAALRAWGTRQDLFASGDATEITDENAIAAATAHPQTPLRRAVGSADPFLLEPTSLPNVPDAPKRPQGKAAATPKAAAHAKKPADRSKLDAAERGLRSLDARRKGEEADFRREEDELQARQSAAQAAYVAARKSATEEVADARTAYRKAGGDD